jgi:hypothetical protein
VGGTAAVIGGGKFANGAVTGAFTHLFNQEMRAREPSSTEPATRRFASANDLEAALNASGPNAYVTGERGLFEGSAPRLSFELLRRWNVDGVHEHLFYIDSNGRVANIGFMGSGPGLAPDLHFPGNIGQYVFGSIAISRTPIPDLIRAAPAAGFTGDRYNLLRNNCQDFCDFIRRGGRR